MKRVAFATDRERPSLTLDDALVIEPAARLGLGIEPAVWDHPEADWARFDAVVVRSTWDYHLRLDEWVAWVDRVARVTRVLNAPEVLRANAVKTYLLDLERRGVPIVPTTLVGRGSTVRPARRVVVKPVVSAGAHLTFVVNNPGVLEVQVDSLVQPYLPAVETEGELSFLFFGGAFSHAVLKRPAPGDFRVQEEHGGTFELLSPSREDLAVARRVMDAAPETLYARVDLVRLDGALRLMELELVEPSLYLALDPDAPARFATALARALG
jgi:glutathione synthase/RimK-type ligase-like ATP-grasp enzyme